MQSTSKDGKENRELGKADEQQTQLLTHVDDPVNLPITIDDKPAGLHNTHPIRTPLTEVTGGGLFLNKVQTEEVLVRTRGD